MKNKRTKAKVLETNRSWNLKEIKYFIKFLRLGEWALFGVFITPKTFNLKENKFVKFVNYQKRLLEKKEKKKNRAKTKTDHNMSNNCLFLIIVLSVRIQQDEIIKLPIKVTGGRGRIFEFCFIWYSNLILVHLYIYIYRIIILSSNLFTLFIKGLLAKRSHFLIFVVFLFIDLKEEKHYIDLDLLTLLKKWSFPLKITSANVWFFIYLL